ncbi:MAG: hypothetical protein ACYDHD_11810, partial [Vulcanimicrobiaceae bacterium]
MPDNNQWGSTIANIYGFQGTGTGQTVFGWAYQTENQDMFFQTNAAATGIGSLLSFFENVPGLGTIAQDLVNATTAPYQLTGTQWQNIESSMQGLKLARFRGHFPLSGERSIHGQKSYPDVSSRLSPKDRRARPS